MKTIIICTLVLSGCATQQHFYREGATNLEFAQDRYQCDQETASRGNYLAAGAPLFVALEADAAQKRERAVFNECMEARGYELVKQ